MDPFNESNEYKVFHVTPIANFVCGAFIGFSEDVIQEHKQNTENRRSTVHQLQQMDRGWAGSGYKQQGGHNNRAGIIIG